MTSQRLSKLRRDWRNHKWDALRRGVDFELTFEAWLAIWIASGKLSKRGPRKGQYVMARNRDRGPYRIRNVTIIMASQNHIDRYAMLKNNTGKGYTTVKGPQPPRHAASTFGSKEHRNRLSKAMQGNKSRTGQKNSKLHKQRISAALKRYHSGVAP